MSKNNSFHNKKSTNVVDLFSGKHLNQHKNNRILRLAPEMDGIEMLYSNDANPEKLFTMKILCWSLDSNNHVDAMVPWLTRLVCCHQLNDPLNGRWEGYYDTKHHRVLYEPPLHKIIELESSCDYFSKEEYNSTEIIQEIPDHIGTHATFSDFKNNQLTLREVISWRLMGDGYIDAMLADFNTATNSPILMNDLCLYSARSRDNFCYYFHHSIANKIKSGDSDVLEAFNRLGKEREFD